MDDHPVLVHGDTIPGVFAELEEGQSRVLPDGHVLGGEVGDQVGHGPTFAEAGPVAGPLTTTADGQGQVGPQLVILCIGQPGQLVDDSVVRYHGQVLLVPNKYVCASNLF